MSSISIRRGDGLRIWARVAMITFSALQAAALDDLLPSPYDILRSHDLETPVLDAVPFCVPRGLDLAVAPVLEQAEALEWARARELLSDRARRLDWSGPELGVLDAVLKGRAAEKREDRILAVEEFRTLLRRPSVVAYQICPRLELARLLLLLSRESEAAAQLSRAQRLIDEFESPGRHADEIRFWQAEILYQTGRQFTAHLAYRELAKSKTARLALAARLRLTDLSFDAGKSEIVSEEYEVLLPRASAYGASTAGWALRASEAALGAGDLGRALRWAESHLATEPSLDAVDTVQIRLADLDVALDEPLIARKRLSEISERRAGDPIGALAALRAIALGVATGSADQRLEILMKIIREQRRGVRRAALGVLMAELSHRGNLDAALAVATRLAYEGLDEVVTPHYSDQLDDLLARVSAQNARRDGCQELIRALGGRYGILIERASKLEPFARVGECFEQMELPWLAANVYRTIARRFGALRAQSIALPLARVSVAIGELTLARRVATAALENPDDDVVAWQAIIAEADFEEGRIDQAAEGLLSILDSPKLLRERGKLVRLLALTLGQRGRIEDAVYIAERVPRWLKEDQANPMARANMVEAVILTAHAHRHEGLLEQAFELYRVVDRYGAPDVLRSSARFWLGLSGELDSAGEAAWGDAPDQTLGSPWGRFALFEERYTPMQSSYSELIR